MPAGFRKSAVLFNLHRAAASGSDEVVAPPEQEKALDAGSARCYFSSMLFSQHPPAPRKPRPALSRRERQIMDILYQRRRASAAEVQQVLPDPPSYSAVRAMLRVLEEKGHIRHEEQAGRY